MTDPDRAACYLPAHMRLADDGLKFAATDLGLHLSCSHLTSLRRAVALGEIEGPTPYEDPRGDVLKARGIEHERRILEGFEEDGRSVETIATDAPSGRALDRAAAAAARTRDAMRQGADVIYQARLEDDAGRWSGYPDFLLRVDAPSALGGWSYEVLDAKLARRAKAEALLQLLLYSDLLERAQGAAPAWMHLALGAPGQEQPVRFRVAEYAAYYRHVRERFEEHAADPPETYPEPVDHCTLCDWKRSCAERRRADDHLSLVPDVGRGQRRRLAARGVTTLAALAALDLPLTPAPDGIGPAALARIRDQARVQDRARQERRRIHEPILPIEENRGLAALPEPSPSDVFFDLEGDAFAAVDGLEYLFGVADRDGAYRACWALDQAGEKRAFERFIDDVMARRAQEPGFHVYHYGAYETTAVKRLMSRYATREEEVDRLLRGDVFVDLHRVVRQGLRASVERYSIKALEPFYGFRRAVDLAAATRALIAWEAALETGGAQGPKADALRAAIEGYNRDDCLSTLRLAGWLESCRREVEAQTGEPVPRPALPEEDASEREGAAATAALFDALVAGLPDDDAALDDDQRARRLTAHLLEFHRREEKSAWWEFFDRCGLTAEEHVAHRTTLGGLVYEGEAGQVKRSVVHRYRFPEQSHEIAVGSTPKNPATAEDDDAGRGACGTVAALDDLARTIDLRRGKASKVPHPAALVPLDIVRTPVLRDSIARLGEAVAESGFAPASPRRAAFDLLRGAAPRIAGAAGRPGVGDGLRKPGEKPLDAIRRIAPRLDRSVLAVQGPPGSGKTYAGARMILDLLAAGRRVGVTANSHKVIANLLDAVCKAADERDGRPRGAPSGQPHAGAPAAVRGIQKANAGEGCADRRIVKVTDNGKVAAALAAGDANLAGGTAWLWAREEMADAVDVLVIDEAGQMSLANTLAVCQAARTLVLLGDPRQLDQPIQGVHPPGADVSALGHLQGGAATVDPDRGVFLDVTWRMHPDICRFTSEQFYGGRLEARPELSRQTVLGPVPLGGHGLRFVPVTHTGNTHASTEEADRIRALVAGLLADGAAWINQHGRHAPLTLADILVVAPYNAHVATLRARLPEGARVGTVDKFQGQEAPIVLYSMATSSADEAPRGMEFLYSLHRLNVATSRARCVAAIVASPALLTPDCRTPEQMRLANAFCRFLELAREAQPAGSPAPLPASRASGA